MKTQVFAVAVAAAALSGSSDAVRANSRGSAEVIFEWNQILQETIPTTAGLMSPRFYAMLHIAMFDAVNAIEREYTPYVGRLPGSHGASADAAAAQAAHDILVSLIPTSQARFDSELEEQLEDIPHGLLGLALGSDDFPVTVLWLGSTGQPDVTRNFAGFWELAQAQADSRVHGGIHYRFDNVAGQQSAI